MTVEWTHNFIKQQQVLITFNNGIAKTIKKHGLGVIVYKWIMVFVNFKYIKVVTVELFA